MKYFAKIENNVVVNIAVGYENPGGYIEYSQTGAFRKNAAVIGGTYDSVNDVFIHPKPYASWTLDNNHDWVSPAGDKPAKEGFLYIWNEESGIWEEFEKINIDL
jgi:hypothetical protein